MKKVYLIHGWGGSSEGGWFDWLKEELKKKETEVYAFDMPDTENPKIEAWVKYLEEKIPFEDVDEETYFVGHSIGCQTIMRFLEKLPKHKEIGGCVFVAGWLNLINLNEKEMEIAHPWINSKINFDRIQRHSHKILAIFSDNDELVPLSELDIFKNQLGTKTLIKKKQGHFNDVKEIPEILEFIK
ncbi:alpha/beta hydrolase [Candidatus Pacearchaeota archaeon]|nr:alpha/beta hydrolase [Candidatus Pacearchaeota archaeon]